jgi:small subunit ribosomal protein S18
MNDNNERPAGGPGGGRPARAGRKDGDKGPGGRRGGFRRRRVCKFCVEHIEQISYKDVRMLSGFIPERGKIQPRRISGTCAAHQRKLQVAIKRARQLALIPYLTD